MAINNHLCIYPDIRVTIRFFLKKLFMEGDREDIEGLNWSGDHQE